MWVTLWESCRHAKGSSPRMVLGYWIGEDYLLNLYVVAIAQKELFSIIVQKTIKKLISSCAEGHVWKV